MKRKLLPVSLMLITAHAFADTTQATLAQLQNQINQLQTQINSLNPSTNLVATDSAVPFGTLSKVGMPLQLVKNRKINTAPLVFGGQIEADLQYWNGSTLSTSASKNYNAQNSSIALTKVYLFNEANINQNTIGFISLKNTLPNNSIVLDRAFLMLGQLNAGEPLFVTVGSTYLPFGNFSGNGPLNNALTTNLFRVSPTDQISANIGKGPFTLIGSMYQNNSINYLVTGLFNKNIYGYTLALGSSYLTNIVGTNSGIGNAFHAYGSTSSASQPLQSSTNPAWDVNISFGKAPLSVLGEYATTLRASTDEDQSIGKLSAWMLGTAGKFAFENTPYNWQISYSKTANMQNIPMPFDGNFADNLKSATGFKNQWLGSIQGEYWKNAYIGPELGYDKLYSNAHTYTLTLDATAYF